MLNLSSQNQPDIKYKFYATLLDSWTYYLKSEYDDALQNFIDGLNRKPFTSEPAEKGTAFNNLVDAVKNGKLWVKDHLGNNLDNTGVGEPVFLNEKFMIRYGQFSAPPFTPFEFKYGLVQKFARMYKGALDQVYIEATLDTPKGKVLLYGYIDEVLEDVISDIKTSSKYEFPKFLYNYQHLVYAYCSKKNGIDCTKFRYDVTDFTNHFREEYIFDESRDVPRLVDVCLDLINFLEKNRDKITSKKLFAEDEPKAVA